MKSQIIFLSILGTSFAWYKPAINNVITSPSLYTDVHYAPYEFPHYPITPETTTTQVPANYEFKYEVNNLATGDIKSHEEKRTGDQVKGTYSLVEPDGSIRTVHYNANELGFNAHVFKENPIVTTTAIPWYPQWSSTPTPWSQVTETTTPTPWNPPSTWDQASIHWRLQKK